MNLVHEENISFAQVGQKCRQVPRLFNGGTGSDADVDPHLLGDDSRQRGLTQARGAVEQHMIQGLLPFSGCLNEDGEIILRLLLSNVLL